MPIRYSYLRLSVLSLLFACIGDAAALGLGDIRVRSALGERFVGEVDVLVAGSEMVDAECFHLRPGTEDSDLPWLRRASLSLRKGGGSPVLEIKSRDFVHDPILQVGIKLSCGPQLRRDYMVFLSPDGRESETRIAAAPVPATSVQTSILEAPAQLPSQSPRQRAGRSAQVSEPVAQFSRTAPRSQEKRSRRSVFSDRLVLSAGDGMDGGLPLRLATNLQSWRETTSSLQEAQRDVLRLEFRMLMAMHEEATSQLAAAQKLRNMETGLAELQQRRTELANRMDNGAGPDTKAGATPTSEVPIQPVARAAAAATSQVVPATSPVEQEGGQGTEWAFYGALLTALLGVGGWLGWRQYQSRRVLALPPDDLALEPVMDPPHAGEMPASAAVDLSVEPAAEGVAMPVDLPLGVGAESVPPAESTLPPAQADSEFSISDGATVDEHFEVNPVMELAEIMLSFGRVKGAAQALQEYIDHNPDEALQPWIRLMDVYRMAGMRKEFEQLSQDLNRHFNVEIQSWDPDEPARAGNASLEFALAGADGQAAQPKASTLEDIEHIRKKVVETWGAQEGLEYLHQLLRDNRGGKRSGFTMAVVEEILFLIGLLETRLQMQKESKATEIGM